MGAAVALRRRLARRLDDEVDEFLTAPAEPLDRRRDRVRRDRKAALEQRRGDARDALPKLLLVDREAEQVRPLELEPELARLDDRSRGDGDERILEQIRLPQRVRREREQHLSRGTCVAVTDEADVHTGDPHRVSTLDESQHRESVLTPASDVGRLARCIRELAEGADEVVRRSELTHVRVGDRGKRRAELVPAGVLRQQALADERPEQVVGRRKSEAEGGGDLLRRAALLLLPEMDEDARRAGDRPDDCHSVAASRSAPTMRSAEGSHASSSAPAYGIGVSSPLTRRGRMSSDSPACSTTAVTTVAPQLPPGGHSCTQTSRPVFATLPTIVSRSSGTSVRGSTTSTSMPSAASTSAAATDRWRISCVATTVMSEPVRTTSARPISTMPLSSGTGPRCG